MPTRDIVQNFFQNITAGEHEKLTSAFADQPRINTPLQGLIQGTEAFNRYLSSQKTWLSDYRAKVREINLIENDRRIVSEQVIDLELNGVASDLPVVVVAQLEGKLISEFRIYHSTWPLTGNHILRSPIIDQTAGSDDEPEAVQKYMKALKEADIAAVLKLFTKDAYVRQPSGDKYRSSGANIKEFYQAALGKGGINLRHATHTFNGKSFAVEFICDFWIKPMTPQCGIAVYDLGKKPSQISAVRIYDDVSPPFE